MLNEFTNVCRRKLKLTWDETDARLGVLRALLAPAQSLTLDLHDAARAIAAHHTLQFFDALLLASALEAGCSTFLSEDMHHGFRIDGLTVQNPFAP